AQSLPPGRRVHSEPKAHRGAAQLGSQVVSRKVLSLRRTLLLPGERKGEGVKPHAAESQTAALTPRHAAESAPAPAADGRTRAQPDHEWIPAARAPGARAHRHPAPGRRDLAVFQYSRCSRRRGPRGRKGGLMKILFWSSMALVLYTYAGYPCLLIFL